MQRLRRFAKYWDLVGNSGNFVETAPLLWRDGPCEVPNLDDGASRNSSLQAGSAFAGFMAFSDWLFQRVGRTDSIALVRLMQLLFEFLTANRSVDASLVARVLWRDYQRGGRYDKPGFLVEHLQDVSEEKPTRDRIGPKRQSRHAVAPSE
jgi:hypothetical protein